MSTLNSVLLVKSLNNYRLAALALLYWPRDARDRVRDVLVHARAPDPAGAVYASPYRRIQIRSFAHRERIDTQN